jgi:hypothetical protein
MSATGGVSSYRHTQPGHTLRVALGAGVLLCIVLWISAPANASRVDPRWIMGGAAMVLVLSAALFWSLTVEIAGGDLRLAFGPGLIRRRWGIRDIESCQAVTNPWWYGWGIHYTPRRWLYNVSGWHAVEIRLRSGKTARIGTDEPDALAAAIREAMAANRQ